MEAIAPMFRRFSTLDEDFVNLATALPLILLVI